MNVSKQVALLIVAAQLSSAALVAGLDFVAINRATLLQESKYGKALQKDISENARKLQAKQQSAIADLQKEEQEVQKKARLMSPSAQQREVLALQKKGKQVQWQLEQEAEGFRTDAEFLQKELDEKNVQVARNLAQEHKWGAIGSAAELVYLNEEIDKTKVVLAKLDELYENEVAAAQKTMLAQANQAEELVTA